jgi:hypothetical protein
MGETVRYIVMRNALVEIARRKHPATSTRALRERDIARAALTKTGWDFLADKPLEAIIESLKRTGAS